MHGNEFLAYQVWIGLPQNTRTKLAKLFNLKPTGESVVHVGVMASGSIGGTQKEDGFTAHDLQMLTIEQMQEVLGSKLTDFYKLFNEVLERIDEFSDTPVPIKIQVPISPENPDGFIARDPEELIKPKTGKNGKKTAKQTKNKSK